MVFSFNSGFTAFQYAESFENIEQSAPVKLMQKDSRLNERGMELRVVGTTPDWFELVPRELIAGRVLLPGDLEKQAPVTVLTEFGARKILATESSIGQTIRIGSDQFEVIRHDSSWKRRNTAVGMAIHRFVGRRIFERLHGPQRHWFKKLVYTPFSRPITRPELQPETRRRLRQVFAPDVARLEEFAGRPFARWLVD